VFDRRIIDVMAPAKIGRLDIWIRQLRRFHHVINSDKVFGIHTTLYTSPSRLSFSQRRRHHPSGRLRAKSAHLKLLVRFSVLLIVGQLTISYNQQLTSLRTSLCADQHSQVKITLQFKTNLACEAAVQASPRHDGQCIC
jgi:hypothetical protein